VTERALVEESVRRDAPIQGLFRTAVEPYATGGGDIPAGGRVLLLFGAANRDPDRYDDPDRFDPERGATDHLGFGSGIHLCLGAHLARREITMVFQELFRTLPDIHTTGEPDRLLSAFINGIKHLPAEWTPVGA